MFLYRVCQICYSQFHWGYKFWKERPQRQSGASITLYSVYIWSTWFMAIDIDLENLVEAVFVRFLHCKFTLFSPSFHTVLWKEIMMHISQRKVIWGSLSSRCNTYITYLKFFCIRDLSLLSLLINLTIICIMYILHEYLFYTLS